MTTTRPRIYLDLDGVIAPTWSALNSWPSEKTAKVDFLGGTLHIRWSPELITALDELVSEFDADVVIVSTWCEGNAVYAGFWPAIAGLIDARLLPYRDSDYAEQGRWKPEGVIADQAISPAPFIWADDWEVPVFGAEMLERTASTPSLLLAPQTSDGLTPEHVAQMRDFLASVTA